MINEGEKRNRKVSQTVTIHRKDLAGLDLSNRNDPDDLHERPPLSDSSLSRSSFL
jgi:hypothetical protein